MKGRASAPSRVEDRRQDGERADAVAVVVAEDDDAPAAPRAPGEAAQPPRERRPFRTDRGDGRSDGSRNSRADSSSKPRAARTRAAAAGIASDDASGAQGDFRGRAVGRAMPGLSREPGRGSPRAMRPLPRRP